MRTSGKLGNALYSFDLLILKSAEHKILIRSDNGITGRISISGKTPECPDSYAKGGVS
jgi:hypothetical protein